MSTESITVEGRGIKLGARGLAAVVVAFALLAAGGAVAQRHGVEQVAHAVDESARERLDVLAADVAAVLATQDAHGEQLAEIRRSLAEIQRSLGRVEGR